MTMFGALSCPPSTANTGMPASLSLLKLVIADSSVTFDGLGWWNRSPAMSMKSGWSWMVLSTISLNVLSKSCRRASRLYCA